MEREYVLMTISWPKQEPLTLSQLALELQESIAELDEDFGVVLVDSDQMIYAYRINANCKSVKAFDVKERKGPFSNPRIDGFGLEG